MSETSNLNLEPEADSFDIEFPFFPTQITWNTVNDTMEWVQSNITIDMNLMNSPNFHEYNQDEADNNINNINEINQNRNHFQEDLNTTLIWLRSNVSSDMYNSSAASASASASMIVDSYGGSSIHCPLCSNQLLFQDYFTHLYEEHPLTYQIWLYFTAPSSTPAHMPYDIDQMSYDELLELCNTVGYHKVGLTNDQKDLATEPIETLPTTSICCTICLSTFSADQEIESEKELVKIRLCSHTFCKECIYEWLNNHKTCPVCIQNVLPDCDCSTI